MGACSIRVTATGMSMREAFDNAVEEAEQEHGHEQGYSGAINCCRLVKEVRKGQYSDDEILSHTDKREVWGYCSQEPIANTNKTKSVVKNYPQKGTRKWETKYVVVDGQGKEYDSAKSQTEAIKKARGHVEKNSDLRLHVNITKTLVEGNSRCATITYKSSTKESEGTYVFIGLAPE